jgi:hypothetical protein
MSKNLFRKIGIAIAYFETGSKASCTVGRLPGRHL